MEEELAIEFVYMFTTTHAAVVGEELLCEYEARNMKDMLYLHVCCRYLGFRVIMVVNSHRSGASCL